MLTTLTLAIDTYDSAGNLIGSNLAMRASSVRHDPHDVFQCLTDALPETWRQVTYDEAVEALSRRAEPAPEDWQQLSIF